MTLRQAEEVDELTYLRHQTLRTVLITLTLALYGWLIALFPMHSWFADWGWGPMFLFLGLLVAFVTQRYSLRLSAAAVVLGLWLALLSAMIQGDQHIAPHLLALVISIAGVLFGTGVVLWITGACVGALVVIGLRLWTVPLSSPQLASPLLLLIATGVVSYLAVRNLYQALAWFRDRAIAAQRNEEAARERQGQLGRTLKALDEAYRRLEFANYDLARARESAEEARIEKQQFAANVSHELRTPLNVLVALTEMMYHSPHRYYEGPPAPRFRGDAHELYRSSRHLLHLIDDVLDLTRVEVRQMRMERRPTPLHEVVTEGLDMIRPLVDESRVELRDDLPDDLPLVDIDRARVQQVLLNLLNNARRFTDRGHIRVTADRQDDFVRLTVSDTGIGIPLDEQPNVFKEFHQVASALERSPEGSGLGLAISKRFIEMHGGHIWVESEGVPELGSRFHLTLPVVGAELVERSRLMGSTPMARIAPTGRGRTLMLWNGDPAVQEMLERRLAEYRVIAVEDRSKLPVLMEQYHPRALVVNATDSSDAEDVADLAGGALPIVTCSLVAERALGEELGVASYLVKPVLQEQFAEALVRFDGRVRRVLIVDNDMQMVRLLTSLLEMVAPNYTVSRAYGGAEGLSEMRRDPPDLVLLDLVMPEVDGYEVLSRMRADAGLRDIPVIAVTGQTRTPEEERRLGQNTVSLRVPDGLTNQETLDYVAGLLDAVPL